jgi:hypothetical protein
MTRQSAPEEFHSGPPVPKKERTLERKRTCITNNNIFEQIGVGHGAARQIYSLRENNIIVVELTLLLAAPEVRCSCFRAGAVGAGCAFCAEFC